MQATRKYKTLLTSVDAKTTKGEKLGWLTGILYLAPANTSGLMDVCMGRSKGCTLVCLNMAGRAQYLESITIARKAKTAFLFEDRDLFLVHLRRSILEVKRHAEKQGMKPAIRINGTSDLPWMAMQMAREFPEVQFYDYTKLRNAWLRESTNYHLTFSRSEDNEQQCVEALAHGLNVAVVFSTKKGQPLPTSYLGAPVIDGDSHDLRFLDGHKGVIIGLRAKGPAKKDTSGFVVQV